MINLYEKNINKNNTHKSLSMYMYVYAPNFCLRNKKFIRCTILFETKASNFEFPIVSDVTTYVQYLQYYFLH